MMMDDGRWLLPEGVEELLPEAASRFEQTKAKLLALYQSWGYELIVPPLMEYLDALLVGAGQELALQTVTFTDQLSGRLMGVRADMTPQVARIEAHRLNRKGPVRLCYCGSILHAKPSHLLASRTQVQLGAELYGHHGSASDLEMMRLMIATFTCLGIEDVSLGLGHVGFMDGLVSELQLADRERDQLLAIYKRKSQSDLDQWLVDHKQEPKHERWLQALLTLHGPASILKNAHLVFADAPTVMLNALQHLEKMVQALEQEPINVYIDLAEFRGYGYHTGVVFQAYTARCSGVLAKGGRYDQIGEAFGRARPATGFSLDLLAALQLTPINEQVLPAAILAAHDVRNDPQGLIAIEQLRQAGEVVIEQLTQEQEERTHLKAQCNRQLLLSDGHWSVQAL